MASRIPLSLAIGDYEIHRALKDPSKQRVVVISHSQAGLKAAIGSVLLGAAWQRSSVKIGAAGWSRWSPRRRERTLAA